MKKITFVTIGAFIFLTLCSLIAYLLKFTPIIDKWVLLIVGASLFLISGAIKIIVEVKRFSKKTIINAVCFFINSIALGFLIRSWYVYRNIDNSVLTMIIATLLSLVYLWIFYLFLLIPFFERHIKAYAIIFSIIALIVYCVIIATTKTTFMSTFGYYSIIITAFIMALCNQDTKSSKLFNSLTISTYSIIIVAIVLLCFFLEGDGLDGLDGFDALDVADVSLNNNSTAKKKVEIDDNIFQ